MPLVQSKSIFLFVGLGKTESTWNVGLQDETWMMCVEKLVGKNEVLKENLSQCNIVQNKSHMTGPGTKPRLPWWKVQHV
jgi:hypothetical protein